MTVPGLPAQGATSWYPWAANIHDLVVTSPGGRLTLAVYDDFTTRADGPIAGVSPAIADPGVTWSTTGAQPPTVASGRLVSSGVGYAYLQLPAAGRLIAAGIEFTAGSNEPVAMAWVTGPSWDLTNLTGHFSFGPGGFDVTIKRGVTFYPLFSGTWRRPLDTTAGKIHSCAIGIVGDSFIVQVNGETFTGPPDPRTKALAGSTVFWEPLTVSGQQGKVAWVAAWTESTSGAPLATNLFVSNADLTSSTTGGVVGNHYQMSEVTIGHGAVNDQPAVTFGASTIYTELSADAPAGSTTLVTRAQIPPGSSISIDQGGTNAESATISGYPAGTSSPFTHTLSAATTLPHLTGDVVVATVSASQQASMYYHQANQFFFMPNIPVIIFPGGNIYLGSDLGAFLTWGGNGVVATSGGGPGKGSFRAGDGWSTANRPTAANAGAGAQGYDTTLGKPIWSDGTAWRDAMGNVV